MLTHIALNAVIEGLGEWLLGLQTIKTFIHPSLKESIEEGVTKVVVHNVTTLLYLELEKGFASATASSTSTPQSAMA